MSRQIRVGIDPAFRKKGFAMCIIDTEHTAKFKIFNSFLDFVTWSLHDRPENAIWMVENSNLQTKCWQKNAMSVGKNQAASQYTVDFLKALGCEVYEISPLQKGRVWSNTIFQNAVYVLSLIHI